MPVDHIRYDLLAQDALRGVVQRVLAGAAKNGLPGDHHFFITFDTRATGVRMSPRLRAQHPEKLTIVLQHQFWDLVVTDKEFEVGLSFSGIPERLTVPIEAISEFFDPSVQFGLQFSAMSAASAAEEKPGPLPVTAVEADASQDRAGPAKPAATAAPGAAAKGARSRPKAVETDDQPPSGGGEVVKLDRFRKK